MTVVLSEENVFLNTPKLTKFQRADPRKANESLINLSLYLWIEATF